MKFIDSNGDVCDTEDLDRAVVQEIDPIAFALRRHAIPALRSLARQRCRRSNCGSVCLCDSCHARKALETLDPTWRP